MEQDSYKNYYIKIISTYTVNQDSPKNYQCQITQTIESPTKIRSSLSFFSVQFSVVASLPPGIYFHPTQTSFGWLAGWLAGKVKTNIFVSGFMDPPLIVWDG